MIYNQINFLHTIVPEGGMYMKVSKQNHKIYQKYYKLPYFQPHIKKIVKILLENQKVSIWKNYHYKI